MARLDIPLDEDLAHSVKFQAESQGQSISEYTRRALRVQVGAEPGPYPFSGPVHGPSFIRDLAMTAGWSQGDSQSVDQAFDRLRKFERWSEDVVSFATQTTSTASQIIPPGYKASVTLALTADRPLASACENLPISSSAPFTVPTARGDLTVPTGRAEGAQPSGSDPTFSSTTATPVGLSGKIDLSRELVDSASPGGDLVALSVLKEDWFRQAERMLYSALNGIQAGTITSGFVPSGAQARVSTTPASNLLIDTKKAVLSYANVRRRKARNIVAGAAALDPNLGGLLGAESASGDDASLARIFGARLNAAVNDYGTAAGDARILILGSDDVICFESPLAQFRFDEQSGPALVTAAVFGYFSVVIARPIGVSSIRF